MFTEKVNRPLDASALRRAESASAPSVVGAATVVPEPPQPEARSARPASRARSAAGARRRAINPSIIGIRPITLEAPRRTTGTLPSAAAPGPRLPRSPAKDDAALRAPPARSVPPGSARRRRRGRTGPGARAPTARIVSSGRTKQRLEHPRQPGRDGRAALASTRADRIGRARPGPVPVRGERAGLELAEVDLVPLGQRPAAARRERRAPARASAACGRSSLATPRSIGSSASASRSASPSSTPRSLRPSPGGTQLTTSRTFDTRVGVTGEDQALHGTAGWIRTYSRTLR